MSAEISGTENTLRLRDGRTLAYTEHGALSGKPVLFLHGNPGSRYQRHPDESIAQSVGARIITPDRPGYGKSDFQPGRKLLNYPDDAAQLMDSLSVDKFAMLGVSAGAPYAAVCAYKLASRATRTAIVSGLSPLDRDNAFEGTHPSLRKGYELVRTLPGWLAQVVLKLQARKQLRDPEGSLSERFALVSRDDQAALTRPEVKAQVLGYRQEAVRQGVKGTLRELQIHISPWGFPLSAIPGEVDVWHWEEDFVAPIQMGRYIASQIPNAHTHFLPGGGHYSIFDDDNWREILKSLIAD
jgi:pimeloyl-ACP methyl ester carboxylesterase